MRKAQKQLLLDLVQTLYEAHGLIKKYINSKKVENAQSMLADCQNTAASMSNIIGRFEGEDFITVRLFEEYCGALFQVYNHIELEKSANNAYKTLNKALIQIENSIKSDITVRLEVVFLPYKASMWDSLESIWKAANDDPDCDAYVVPIPYYDRNPDNSFGAFHYEGTEYPPDVPIVHYESYHFEKRRPDAVFFHNPYDDCNRVTSVDPRFYASELKKHTDMLVYIPYFVVSHIVPEHFCTTSGCVFADKVFVQSEEICKSYVEYYTRAYGNTQKPLANKFLDFGSPKFDRVLNTCLDAETLPSGWYEKIRGKKVVLYNTSIASLLEENTAYLKKLLSVFNYFMAHQEDAILWWRPHPLSESTYHSMRHELLDEYLKIADWYRRSKIGIYDDTSDLHRAIAFSDAYYGDRSSLVALYQLTGKPVLLQDTSVITYESYPVNLVFEDLYDDGESLWFSSFEFNGLFKMDKTTLTAQFIDTFPNEYPFASRLYGEIAEVNGKLYFPPMAAKEIAVYDKEKKTFEKIKISEEHVVFPSIKLYSAISYKESVIFTPYGYSAILIYNTVTKSLTYVHDFFSKLSGDPELGYFYRGVISSHYLYLPCMNANRMAVLNLNNLETEIVSIGSKGLQFHGVCNAGGRLWLSPYTGGRIAAYDIADGNVKYVDLPEGVLSAQSQSIGICKCGESLYLFPYHNNAVVQLDASLKTSAVEAFDHICQTPVSKILDGHFLFAKTVGDCIYAYDIQNERLTVYHPDSGVLKEVTVSVSTDEIRKSPLYQVNDWGEPVDLYNFQEKNLNIANIVSYFAHPHDCDLYNEAVRRRAEIRKRTITNPDGTAGQKIYNNVKMDVITK